MARVHKSRGLAHYGSMDWNMFPQKLERTPIFEDDNQTESFHRNTLKDFSSDPASLAGDRTRNRYDGVIKRHYTGTRSGLEPYNPDLFLGFTDRDPRGHLLEPNGEEARRHQHHRKKYLEQQLYSDADWSVPSAGIHPNTKYAQMRRTQPWIKSRLKIFTTGKDGWQHGGRVEIPHNNYMYNSVATDENMAADLIHLNPEHRMHKTTKLSNGHHLGYRTTGDHEFKVSSYGKMFTGTPAMDHQSQVLYVNPDQKLNLFLEEGGQVVPRSVTALMSALTKTTAAEANRLALQLKGEMPDYELSGLRAANRGHKTTDDILQLLQYIEQDADFTTSETMVSGKSASPARNPEKIKRLSELLHSLPANVKLQLTRKIAGAGLKPGDPRSQMNQTVVDPKIIEFMSAKTRTNKGYENESVNRRNGLSTQKLAEGRKVFVSRAKAQGSVMNNKRNATEQRGKYKAVNDLPVFKFSGLKKRNIVNNKKNATADQDFNTSDSAMTRRPNHTNYRPTRADETRQDIEMANAGVFTRHGGRVGKKYQQRELEVDTVHNELNDLVS